MIDSFLETIKLFSTFAVIGIIAIVVIIAVVKGREYYEDHESKQKNERNMRDAVNKIKDASMQWSRPVKLNYMKYLSQQYEKLENCQSKPIGGGYASKTSIMANIQGNTEYFSVDLDAIYDLYNYLDLTLDD